MCIITDCALAFHPRPLPTYKYRILYAGNDLAMSKRLRETLSDCQIVRAPDGSAARLFIRGINYSLLLFDHELPDTTGTELAQFTRALPHRERTQIILISPNEYEASIVAQVARSLAARRPGARNV